MKKLILSAALSFLTVMAVYAQKASNTGTAKANTGTVKVVEDEDVPQAVIQAFKKDFPGIKSEGWRVLPKAQLKNDEDFLTDLLGNNYNPEQEPYDFYSIRLIGKGDNAIAVYNSNGKLIMSKEVIKDTALPIAVSKSIETKYKNWKITGDKEEIKNLNTAYYKVHLKNGNEKESFYFDKSGDMVSKKMMKS